VPAADPPGGASGPGRWKKGAGAGSDKRLRPALSEALDTGASEPRAAAGGPAGGASATADIADSAGVEESEDSERRRCASENGPAELVPAARSRPSGARPTRVAGRGAAGSSARPGRVPTSTDGAPAAATRADTLGVPAASTPAETAGALAIVAFAATRGDAGVAAGTPAEAAADAAGADVDADASTEAGAVGAAGTAGAETSTVGVAAAAADTDTPAAWTSSDTATGAPVSANAVGANARAMNAPPTRARSVRISFRLLL
jgi:hypothetical protein